MIFLIDHRFEEYKSQMETKVVEVQHTMKSEIEEREKIKYVFKEFLFVLINRTEPSCKKNL